MPPDPRKNGRQPQSAELIAGHDDLLIQILLLLPPKSLVRFTTVCKHWRALISAASFPRLHLLNHSRRRPDRLHSFILGLSCVKSQYLVCSPTAKTKLTHLNFPSERTRILQSCNGLLLVDNGEDHCVLNPTTMQYRNLNTNATDECYLSFDPSESDRYRVFRFERSLNRFHVFDSAANKWQFLSEFPMDYSNGKGISCGDFVFFFGYWHASCLTPQGQIYDDIEPYPKRGCRSYIMESNGYLHYIRLSLTKFRLEVYEMIKRKWIHCKSADPDQLRATLGSETSKKVELLGMVRRAKVEDSMFLVHVPGRILIYRFSDRVCEVVDDFRSQYFYKKDQLQFSFKDAHLFIPSFAPV